MSFKRTIYLILFGYLILSCSSNKKEDSKTINIVKKENSFQSNLSEINRIKFPIDSVKYINYIKFDGTYHEIDSTNITSINKFSKFINNTVSGLRKEDSFYHTNEKAYFPLFKYKLSNDIIIIGFIVEYWLEDTKGVLLQINTFNNIGKQLDYLIILNRFSYEGVLNKTNFQIQKDFKQIKLLNITIDGNEYNEVGDIIFTNKEVTSKIIKTEQLFIINNQGRFKKIK